MNVNNGSLRPASILGDLLSALPSLSRYHKPGSKVYTLLKQVARREVETLFSDEEPQAKTFGPLGELIFPYFKMGNIDSLNLFDIDELIILTYYLVNRKRYRRVIDIGANIGLHSVIMSKCGFQVRSYEPDPRHFEILRRNLELNNCSNVQGFNKAVSNKAGELEFVRVLGNTTGSHLAGSKPNPYGDLERFPVKVEAFEPLIIWADLIKLDVEGHEKVVLLSTELKHWVKTDALVEIENADNAAAVYGHFTTLGVKLFSQKTNWQQVHSLDDMPTSYHEGTLFVTCRDEMPWA